MNDLPKSRDVAVPPGTSPAFRDYPRLVFNAPYFTQNPLAEMFAPAVLEAAMQVIPGVLETSTLLQDTVDAEVRRLAVMRAGDTMSGPLFFADPLPTQDSQAASKLYVDMMAGTGGGGGIEEVPLFPINEVWARVSGSWLPISGLLESGGIPEPGLGNWLRSPGAWVEGMPINGGVFRGPVTLSANATTGTMQPVTMAQLEALLAALDTSGTGPDITGLMPKSGGAFSGPITLSGDATASMHPITLQQLNFRAANTLPLVDATPGVIGTSLLYARQDHVHPTDTSRVEEAPEDGNFYGRQDGDWTQIGETVVNHVNGQLSGLPNNGSVHDVVSAPLPVDGGLWLSVVRVYMNTLNSTPWSSIMVGLNTAPNQSTIADNFVLNHAMPTLFNFAISHVTMFRTTGPMTIYGCVAGFNGGTGTFDASVDIEVTRIG